MTGTATGSATGVLRVPGLDRALSERGYVVVPFLCDAEVRELREEYVRLRADAPESGSDEGLTIDFVRPRRHMMHALNGLLDPVWSRHLPTHFVDYEPVVSTFVVKYPGPSSEMRLHHEPTFTELGVPTYNIWIPLVDVTEEADNGSLELVLGTEHLDYGYVGFNTPVLFRPFEEFLVAHAKKLDVRAGEAVIYDTRMLHRSSPNESTSVRPAIAAALAPKGAPLVHAVATGNRSAHLYGVDTEFFLDLHPVDVPEAIGDRYRVIEEVATAGELSGRDLARAVGEPTAPIPEVLIPVDLCDAAVTGRLAQWPTPLDLSGLPEMEPVVPGPVGTTGLTIGSHSGEVAARSLIRNWKRTVTGSRTGTISGSPFSPVRDAVGVTLGPGARTQLVLEWRRGGTLSTVDCAPLAAGVLDASGSAQLEPGMSSDVASARGVTVWNDGPAPATLIIWRRESPVAVIGSLLRRS